MTRVGPSENRAGRVAQNAAALGVSKAFTSGLLLAWQVALARMLGAEQYGIYGTIGAMMAVGAAIPDPGVGVTYVRDVARRPEEAGRYLAAALALHAVLGVFGYLVLQAGAAVLGYDADVRALVAFVGVNLLIDALATAGHNQLIAAERMSLTAVLSAAHIAVLVVAGMLVLIAGGGLWGVYGAVFAAGLLRLAAYWVALRRRGWSPAFPVDRAAMRHLVLSGLPLGIAAFLSLGFLHADKLATTAMLGAESTGHLTAAFVIVFGTIELLGTTVLVAAFPVMSRLREDRDGGAALGAVSGLLHFNLLVGIPIAALLMVFAPEIASLIFGPGFGGAVSVLRVMSWYIVVRLAEGVLTQALIVEDRQRQVLVIRAFGLALNLAVTVILLPRLGLVAAAMGMIVGEVVVVASMVGVVRPSGDWWAEQGPRFATLAVPATALVAVLVALANRIPPVPAAIAGLAIYAGLAVVTGAITEDHRRLLAQVAWHAPAAALRRRWPGARR